MSTPDQQDQILQTWFREEADVAVPAHLLDTVAADTARRRPRPAWQNVFHSDAMWSPRPAMYPSARFAVLLGALVALLAAIVVGALLVGGNRVPRLSVVPPLPTPSLAALVPASPEAASASPSKLATASPSPTSTPIAWTKASLKQDWPAPVRTEPVGQPIVVPILYKRYFVATNGHIRQKPCHDCTVNADAGTYVDPTADTGSTVHPWVDITKVDFCGTSCLWLSLANGAAGWDPTGLPLVGPTDQWMAYGVVLDTDRDGVADWRYGVDNMPLEGKDGRPIREWRTDLHTGRTEASAPADQTLGETFWDTFYPGRWNFGIGDDIAGAGPSKATWTVPFYVWASEIKDGQVVATDYAPDTGWLVSSPNAKP